MANKTTTNEIWTYDSEYVEYDTEVKRYGIIEDLAREIEGPGRPFLWGIRETDTGVFFLMEPDCIEMEDGYKACFTVNSNSKISEDAWDYIRD